MMKRLRRYLVAGILVWLPLGVTIIIVRFLIGLDIAMARGSSRFGLDRGGWLR